MNPSYGALAPPRPLAERLRQLNDNLQALGERLKASIASIVGETISETVGDAVRRLLGAKELPPEDHYCDRSDYRDRFRQRDYHEREDDPWCEDDRRWSRDD